MLHALMKSLAAERLFWSEARVAVASLASLTSCQIDVAFKQLVGALSCSGVVPLS